MFMVCLRAIYIILARYSVIVLLHVIPTFMLNYVHLIFNVVLKIL